MTTQTSIPCIMMRGGTSKGPYFRASDLPEEIAVRDRVLLAAMGSPDPRQIDGLGGSDTLTSKVAIVGPSEREGVDVDFLFAQVSVTEAVVDTGPSCGNILSGVGPFALETGMVERKDGTTSVMIYNVNTASRIEAVIQTTADEVIYAGDTEISGVPGTAAPIRLNFMDIAGSKTGSMLPTGAAREEIDGVEVTLIDVAVPMMIFRAADLGKTGYETPAELDADTTFFARMEAMRRIAGERMGLGDVTGKVLPKAAMIAPPREGGQIAARYFVPHKSHAAFAVTGGMCLASCVALAGSICEGVGSDPEGDDRTIVIEHPTGTLDVALATTGAGADMSVVSGGVIRTARKLMSGEVFVPSGLFSDRAA